MSSQCHTCTVKWCCVVFVLCTLSCLTQVNGIEMCTEELFASCSDDGSVRIWSIKEREQTLQFQVMDQVLAFVSATRRTITFIVI